MLKKIMCYATILALLLGVAITTSCTKDDPTEPTKPSSITLTPSKPKPEPQPEPEPEPEPQPEKKTYDMSWLNIYDADWWRQKTAAVTITSDDLRLPDPNKMDEQFVAQVWNRGVDVYSGIPTSILYGFMFLCEIDEQQKGEIAFIFLDSNHNIIGNSYTDFYNADGNRPAWEFYLTMDLEPGKYFVVPVFRPQGESKWILPYLNGYIAFQPFEGLESLKYENWGYEVLPAPKDCLTIYNILSQALAETLEEDPTYPTNNGLWVSVDVGEPFTTKYIFCNNTGKDISGTLTVRDIRSYKGCNVFLLDDKALGGYTGVWDREIYSCHIEIPADTQVFEGTFETVLTEPNHVAHSYGGSSHQLFYFTPDGSTKSYQIPLDKRRIMSALQTFPQELWREAHYRLGIQECFEACAWTNQTVD